MFLRGAYAKMRPHSARRRMAQSLSCLTPALFSIAAVAAPLATNAPMDQTGRYHIDYGTFIGTNLEDDVRDTILYPDGTLLFGARILGTTMWTSANAAQKHHGGGTGDSYLGKLNASGSALLAGTYFGGNGIERPPYGIALAPDGDIVFCSATRSTDLPKTAGRYRPSLHPEVPGNTAIGDGYVARISSDLSTLRWTTYTGGGWPRGGCTVDTSQDPLGEIVVVGDTRVDTFSTTAGAIKATKASNSSDAFVLKLNSDATAAIFSTLLGGSAGDTSGTVEVATSVRVDAQGAIHVAGNTPSIDFPMAGNSVQAQYGGGIMDAFVATLSANGTQLLYGTFLRGSGDDFAEHRLWLEPDGTELIIGGADYESPWVTSDFSTSAHDGSDTDAVLTALGTQGHITWATRLGGLASDHGLVPTRISASAFAIVGETTSDDLPVTADALQPSRAGGSDGFVAIFDESGSLLYFTYLGGSQDDNLRAIAVGQNGELYLTGRTSSADFPATVGAHKSALTPATGTQPSSVYDGFVIKLVPNPPAAPPEGDQGVGDEDGGASPAEDAGHHAEESGSAEVEDDSSQPGEVETNAAEETDVDDQPQEAGNGDGGVVDESGPDVEQVASESDQDSNSYASEDAGVSQSYSDQDTALSASDGETPASDGGTELGTQDLLDTAGSADVAANNANVVTPPPPDALEVGRAGVPVAKSNGCSVANSSPSWLAFTFLTILIVWRRRD